jgi:hypothetical protein
LGSFTLTLACRSQRFSYRRRGESERAMFYDQNEAATGRLLGLDIIDWSMLLVAIGLSALLVVFA